MTPPDTAQAVGGQRMSRWAAARNITDILFSKQMIIVGIDGLEAARTSRASFGYDIVDYPNFFIMDMGLDFTNGDTTFASVLTFYQETELQAPAGSCYWTGGC